MPTYSPENDPHTPPRRLPWIWVGVFMFGPGLSMALGKAQTLVTSKFTIVLMVIGLICIVWGLFSDGKNRIWSFKRADENWLFFTLIAIVMLAMCAHYLILVTPWLKENFPGIRHPGPQGNSLNPIGISKPQTGNLGTKTNTSPQTPAPPGSKSFHGYHSKKEEQVSPDTGPSGVQGPPVYDSKEPPPLPTPIKQSWLHLDDSQKKEELIKKLLAFSPFRDNARYLWLFYEGEEAKKRCAEFSKLLDEVSETRRKKNIDTGEIRAGGGCLLAETLPPDFREGGVHAENVHEGNKVLYRAIQDVFTAVQIPLPMHNARTDMDHSPPDAVELYFLPDSPDPSAYP